MNNSVPNTQELEKISFSGFVFVVSVNMWVVRFSSEDEWTAIPRDVLEPNKYLEQIISFETLIGRLFISGYRGTAEILLKQIEDSKERDHYKG